MDLSQLSETEFGDIFGGGTNAPQGTKQGLFSSSLDKQGDIFNSTEDTTTIVSTTDTTTLQSSTEDTTTLIDDVNLLGGGEGEEGKKGAGRPPKYDFSDMSGYVQDRVKNGFFTPVEVTNEKGEKELFIPKTPEEFDEVFDLQIQSKVEAAKEDLDKSWYSEKTPAWQIVAQYAEKVSNPADLIPFLQGVKNIQSVVSIDETQIEGAEKLVRMQLEASKQPQALIDIQIESLKTTNKLLDAAKDLKPAMVQAEQQGLAALNQQKQKEFNDYRNMVVDIRDNAIKAIEAPIGKEKLKQEEKAAIYELIAVPDEQSKGYAIFDKIDELFEKKDFEKLKKIALLLVNEESLTTYISAAKVEKVAGDIQRKITLAGSSKGSGKDQSTSPEKGAIQRNTYNRGGSLFSRQ